VCVCVNVLTQARSTHRQTSSLSLELVVPGCSFPHRPPSPLAAIYSPSPYCHFCCSVNSNRPPPPPPLSLRLAHTSVHPLPRRSNLLLRVPSKSAQQAPPLFCFAICLSRMHSACACYSAQTDWFEALISLAQHSRERPIQKA